jgi:site-specific DNA recombinase
MRKISKIEHAIPTVPKRKKVAAYTRVSEEKGRTLHSLSAQVSFYNNLIQKNPDWEYVGVYTDGGITGTSTESRAEFQRMLADCDAGKIDVVLTKSISRFARNTVDLLETVRHLKDLGIEVRFEKEGINSLSGDGELMLAILASFAQEESRSISENVKWSIRKDFEKGKTNSFCIYGYRWTGKEFVIVPEEAEIISLIFKNFMNGMSAEETEKQLEEMGVKSYTGGRFSNTSIRKILTQEKYTGNMLLQKTFVESHITHRTKINRGELPMYYAENTHPAIIDKETFDVVQAEIARRRALGVFANKSISTTCFTSKIKCGICGKSYRRSGKRQRKDSSEVYYIWICRTKSEKKYKTCKSKDIPEEVVKRVCAEALGLEEFDEEVFLEQLEKMVVNGVDELIFHFYDGRIVHQHWESTASRDCWTKERRIAKSIYFKKNPRSSGQISYLTGKIRCDKCGQNFRKATKTSAAGEKYNTWYCASGKNCDSKGIREEMLKNKATEVLGILDFDETLFNEQIDHIGIISNSQMMFYFNDGHTAIKEWY